ncbi:enterotoxin [Acidobacterium sp. S8]|uniref:enterotoxin n=1 Tax=Acidobacterium sp. S8 TaxID=1641854 RepID=UPI00131B01C8|nr:enterotoxin [Acidobacterium sp. S8]
MTEVKKARKAPLRASAALFVFASFGFFTAHAQDAGKAVASVHGSSYKLADHVIDAAWKIEDGKLADLTVSEKLHNTTVQFSDPFAILLKDGTIYNAANLRVDGEPKMTELTPDPNASRYSDRLPGEQCTLALTSVDGNLHATWIVVLRDGSSYVRQFLSITAGANDLPINRVQLVDVDLPGARIVGSVKGSPIVSGNIYIGFEHPLSDSKVVENRATAYMDRDLPLKAGQSVTYSSVIGTTHTGQLRRDFLTYIERERAHPYRTFLHYNSWYDLGYFNAYDQTGVLDRINTFGHELHEKRGVTLDSFLFDDGWDNHASLWSFNKGFPEGFTPVREAANKYGAAPGIWMSPWGGYDGPKKERVQLGKEAGYEIVDGGFALSGPKYYARFRDIALEMIRKYGVNQFKFDGTGNANSVFRGSAFDSDFSAAIHLIGELREAKPDIYINLTTGTYPSPFWLLYADSIWRGGEDDSFAGVGSYRERWITYRDADTYDEIVKGGPLYPLNSLMLHGIIYAQRHKQLSKDPGNDFRNEVRDYFGNGTQLQEMYITPSLLSGQNWDDLAEAAKWSRSNMDVLKDTHWVGGDPAWLEVYGWASWSPRKGILVLRNPSDKPQSIRVDLQSAFELPPGASQSYDAKSPWKDDASKPAIELRAKSPHEFQLAPFEVLTLDVTPR